MAKKNITAVSTDTEWQYEISNTLHANGKFGYYVDHEWVEDEPTFWVDEDDERSASYKAKKHTGNVRFREVTTTTEKLPKNGRRVETSTSDWTVKQQNLV